MLNQANSVKSNWSAVENERRGLVGDKKLVVLRFSLFCNMSVWHGIKNLNLFIIAAEISMGEGIQNGLVVAKCKAKRHLVYKIKWLSEFQRSSHF